MLYDLIRWGLGLILVGAIMAYVPMLRPYREAVRSFVVALLAILIPKSLAEKALARHGLKVEPAPPPVSDGGSPDDEALRQKQPAPKVPTTSTPDPTGGMG